MGSNFAMDMGRLEEPDRSFARAHLDLSKAGRKAKALSGYWLEVQQQRKAADIGLIQSGVVRSLWEAIMRKDHAEEFPTGSLHSLKGSAIDLVALVQASNFVFALQDLLHLKDDLSHYPFPDVFKRKYGGSTRVRQSKSHWFDGVDLPVKPIIERFRSTQRLTDAYETIHPTKFGSRDQVDYELFFGNMFQRWFGTCVPSVRLPVGSCHSGMPTILPMEYRIWPNNRSMFEDFNMTFHPGAEESLRKSIGMTQESQDRIPFLDS